MKIVGIEAHLCHFPLPKTFFPSWIPGYPQGRNSALILQLHTDEGITGISAGVAFLDETKGLPGLLRPFLLNRDPFLVEDFIQVLRSASFLGYRACFVEIAAADAAAWDICDNEARAFIDLYNSKIGNQCCERVVGDLRFGCRDH